MNKNTNNNNNYYDDYIVMDEGLVDISSGDHYRYSKNDDNKSNSKKHNKKSNKKKIAIIASVAATVGILAGVACFCIFTLFPSSTNENGEFVFREGTTVSGVSIAGKTMSQAKSLLESKQQSFIKPVDITVEADGEITSLTQADFTYTFDIDEVLNEVKRDTLQPKSKSDKEKTYEITATVEPDSVQKKSKQIADKTNQKAVNARVSKFTPYNGDDRFEYEDQKKGRELDEDDLNGKLSQALLEGKSSYRLVAEVESVDAEITIDDVKKNIVKLASYETVSYNSANGTENMRVSLGVCNGSVIEPGATWSFNKCTGDSNLESNGYKPAGVITNGQMGTGVGGGICQSSSTIYNAAIRANMKVEERYCHQWASSYVATGLDATIDYPRLDLKLSNPTKYQMFLECKLDGSTLKVSIWGCKGDYDEIRTENQLVSKGGSSYKVKAWRVYIKDDKEIDREELPSSTYDTQNGYFFISADSSKPEPKPSEDDNNDPTSKPAPVETEPATEKPAETQAPTEPRPTDAPTAAPTDAPSNSEPDNSGD